MRQRITLTIEEGNVVTFPQEVLDHLGIPSGGSVEETLLPNGTVLLSKIAANEVESKAIGATKSPLQP